VIVGYMLQLTDELALTETGESDKVRRRLSLLVNELGGAVRPLAAGRLGVRRRALTPPPRRT